MHHAVKPVARFFSTLATLFLLLGLNEAALAARPQVFTAMDRSKVAAPRFDIKSEAAPIAIDRRKIAALAQNDEMDLALPDGKSYVVTFDRVEDHGGGIFSRVGYLREHGNNFRVILTSGPGGTFGSIITPDTHYRVVPGDGSDWLVDMTEENVHVPFINLGDDYRRVPLSAESARKKFDPVQSESQRLAQDSPEVSIGQQTPAPVTIDLMIVYTNGLAARLGTSMMTRFYNLVTAANLAYADSQIGINLRLVHATQVNYTDDLVAKPNGAVLDDITPGRPQFNAAIFGHIEGLRTTVGADLVAVLRSGEDSGGSGLAWMTQDTATTFNSLNNNFMYSVTTGCVVGCDSVFIHEMGHNMGNAHDRATEAVQQGGIANPQAGAYPYSFGHYVCATGALSCNAFGGGCGVLPQCSDTTTNPRYVNPSNIGTIMSYFNPVTLKFSNPNINCTQPGGSGATYPCGVANTIDNARSMNNMRTVISNVKATQVASPTGALQFTATSFTASETGGIATVTVSRVGGSGGTVSVAYATLDGVAKAGFDYVASSGTLTWADGDTATKSFTVALTNDGVTEGDESFGVVLSNPTGATGIMLGNPTTASVVIQEGLAWPPGGVMPAGFVTPGASSGAWTTATDFASEGSVSLRSARVNGNGTTFTNSDVTFTGNFVNGTVSFEYRVSSYGDVPGITQYGFFEFLIDGQPQFSDAGESGTFVPLSFPILAGPHTLTWRYKNRANFFCNNPTLSPAPPGGTNCADRAWIDALSMPLAVATSTTTLGSSANPSVPGQSVTFTATVTGLSGTPAGVVNFKDNGSVIVGCSLVALSGAGVATCTTSALSTGTRSITAEYSGNATYDTSVSNTVSQSVNGVPTLLTVNKAGNGAGTVTSSPAGISCGATCAVNFGAGSVITLTATPTAGSSFTGWSGGGCSGTGTCVVTLALATTVTATFTLQQFAVSITKAGNGAGTVTSSPAGINCGATCSSNFDFGTVVTLTAAPTAGSNFTGWSGGGCSGTGTCNVTVSAATAVTATFTLQQFALTVSKAGNGAGTVTSAPAGINCGATCSTNFNFGTVVTLTAAPTAGSTFTGWSGGGCSGTGTCNVTVSAAASVTATFTLQQFALTVSKAGNGAGTVTSSPAGINCGATCSTNADFGTVVTLTAAPTAGSTFTGWSGGGCTGTGTCNVTVSAATTVTATFTLQTFTLTTAKSGTGTGTITGTGISCGVDCSEVVNFGTTVVLTATPDGTSSFAGWSGGGCTGTGTCSVTVSAATTVTATFTLLPVTLTVAKSGNGTGTVAGTGISCGADCSEVVTPGTVVALTATPTAGSSFTGWSGGGCSGTGTCNVTVSAATTVTATFTLQTFTLTAAKAGTGTGTVTGTGFNCGADCTEVVNFGTIVVLTATPDGTSSFAGWSGGGCSGTGTCSVTVSAATTVTATFTLLPVTLTVATAGNGTGSVAGTGISCPGDCTETVAPGTVIALTATPTAGSNFAGWSGGGCSGTGVCSVTVSTATSVTATFTLQTFTLTITRTGVGTGTVTSSPAGIACGATCASVFNFGTVVALTASPAVGSTFTGWSGGGCSGTGSCNVTMSAAATVNAAFAIATNPPGAPTSVSATAGNALALVSFAAPLSDGGSPITSYTATCGAATPVSGTTSPITVTGLANGVAVTCSVTATNINGTGPGATSNSVTPSAGAAIALSSVVSRKSHAAAGNQDLTVAFATPLAGLITVEPRTNTGGHTLRLTFNVPVNSVGTATVTDGTNAIGTASASADGSNVVTVTLTGVPDNRRAQVSVNNVNGSFLAQANIGFLVGDVTGNGKV